MARFITQNIGEQQSLGIRAQDVMFIDRELLICGCLRRIHLQDSSVCLFRSAHGRVDMIGTHRRLYGSSGRRGPQYRTLSCGRVTPSVILLKAYAAIILQHPHDEPLLNSIIRCG